MREKSKRWSFLLIFAMLITMLPVSALSAGSVTAAAVSQFTDMPDDWSATALEHAVENGLIAGFNGKIMPRDSLTRAQMATIIVRAFGASVSGDITAFSDVKASDWFADSMAKAYQMGVIRGSGEKMNPNAAITREEVFVILARALKLRSEDTVSKSFSDVDKVSDWAAGAVYALVNNGYINGSDGYLNPGDPITRAQFAQMMDNTIKQYITAEGSYTAVSAGNVMINAAGVVLKDVKITGDLIIGDGVGDGEITLDNVDVAGRLVVRGGGENSIIIRGSSTVSNVIVARVDGAVSVKVQGDANVEVVYVDDGSNDVSVEGAVGTIEVVAPNIAVKTVGATVSAIHVAGSNSTIVVDANSTVSAIGVQAEASAAKVEVAGKVTSVTTNAAGTRVTGTGSVNRAEAQEGAAGSKFETPNTKIIVSEGVTGVTGGGGTEVTGGTTVTNTSDGSGTTTATTTTAAGGGDLGGGTVTTPVTAAAISGDAVVGQILTVSTTPSGASVSYQWQRSDASSGYDNIPGATAGTYWLTAADAGKTVRVVVTGSGSYTGTVTSGATVAAIGISATPISFGTSNPMTSVGLTGDAFASAAADKDNWNFSFGSTGLALKNTDPISIHTGNTGVTIDFTGIAAEGTLTIQAKAAALTGGVAGNTISIVIAPNTAATLTSTIGTVNDTAETIVDIPYGTTLTDFEAAITPADGAGFETYQSDGTTVATTELATGYKVIVTAQDGTTTKTYTLTVITPPASVPSAVTLAAGSSNPVGGVTNVAIPDVGETDTTGAVTGWVSGTRDAVRFTVADASPAVSAITINSSPYTSGDNYVIAEASSLTIVITTTETGKAACVRTFTVTVAEAVHITAIGDISGMLKVGQTLSAGSVTPTGATVSYQWMSCATAGGDYVNISGATASTYQLTANETGKYIKVTATGTGDYAGGVTSAASPAAVNSEITAIAAITGTPSVGSTLTAGALTPSGATVSYQWMSCSTADGIYAPIVGASSATYMPAVTDIGMYIKVQVSGTGNYSGTVTSGATPIVTSEITDYVDIPAVDGGYPGNLMFTTVGDIITHLASNVSQVTIDDGTGATVPLTGSWSTGDTYVTNKAGIYTFTRAVDTSGYPTGYSDDVGRITTVSALVYVGAKVKACPGISCGTVNPTGIIVIEGDTYAAGASNVDNWNIDCGTTGLTVSGISLDGVAGSTVRVNITFSGTAVPGTITYQAKAGALTSGVASDTMTDNVRDMSGFIASLETDTNKTVNVAFNLSISGATDVTGTALSGNVTVTVDSDLAAVGHVFNSQVEFTGGEATVPVTLHVTGYHTLTITVTGVTNTKTVYVMVISA